MTTAHARFPVDLHTHTRASDGTDAPAQLILAARQAGLEVIGVTDHDTVAGLEEALAAGRTHGVDVVPGVEISIANDPALDFQELHLLGYFIDPGAADLGDALARAAAARSEQKIAIVHNLQRLGFDVPVEQVQALAGAGVLGRIHVARVLWERNAARFTDRDQIFREYISVGGKAYEPRRYQITLDEAILLIRGAGGMPALAHPGAYRAVRDIDGMARRAASLGLAGLEGPYTYDKNRPHFGASPAALEALIAHFVALADDLGLPITGGSDYHGENKSIALGEQGLTRGQYERLRQVWGRMA
jgi:3',5'-nucleoside bisphosphate phosphatase